MSFEEFFDYASQEIANICPWLDIPWGPYFEVTRLNQPLGLITAVLLYCIALAFAASVSWPLIRPKDLLGLATQFLLWLFVTRHALCTLQTAVDSEYDRQVQRRKSGPVARGALTTDEAFNFGMVQLLLGIWTLARLPKESHGMGVIVTIVMMLYPYGKRFTSFPQVIRGLGFSLSVFQAGKIIGVDLAPGSDHFLSALYLGSACMLLAVVANVIYSYQDMRDEAQAGWKSMALTMGDRPKLWLWIMIATASCLLWNVGSRSDFSILYYITSCGGSFFGLSTMLALIDLRVPVDCEWWFRRGILGTLASIAISLSMEYIIRLHVFA